MSNNYIFSPGEWSTLESNMVNLAWANLNINSCWNMYIQFDILITTYYSEVRNIFNITDSFFYSPAAVFITPNSTNLCITCSTLESSSIDLNIVEPIPYNTQTNIALTFYNGSINIYYNSILISTESIQGNLVLIVDDSILKITDSSYLSDGGIQIQNLTFGNLSDNIKCGRYNFCLGIEPDNNIYCYGGSPESGCLWGGPYCTSDEQCRAEYNITSPKYNGAPANQICSMSPQDCNCWESDACPNNYNLYINSSPCSYQMSPTELQCYQNNNPDLNTLTPSQLQNQWLTSGCKEQRNNQCPSYQTNSGLYNFIGCFNMNQENGFAPLPNNRGLVNSIDDCQSIASNNNESLFGVSNAAGNGGTPQCFTGNDLTRAQQYDRNVNRNQCAPLGGNSTYQLYQRVKPFPPPVPASPILTTSNFANSIETFENKKENKYLILLILILVFIIWMFYIYIK